MHPRLDSPLVHTGPQQIRLQYHRPSHSTGRQLVQGHLHRTRPLSNNAREKVQAHPHLQIRVKPSSARRASWKSCISLLISQSPLTRIFQRIKSFPSQIAFEIALFPNNIPLPTQKVSARIIGGTIHFLHFWILASHDNDDGWDNVSGVKNTAWFDWVSIPFQILTFQSSHTPQSTPITIFLIAISIFNSYSLALRNRNYKFHHRTDPLASPHAKFVVTKLDLDPIEQPSLSQRSRSNVSYAFSYSWRWLFGMQPPNRRTPHIKDKTTRVQELGVWEPSELELELFSIYSPAHALLWLGMGSSSWILAFLVMALVSLQVR